MSRLNLQGIPGMKLSNEEVLHIARLARLGLGESEAAILGEQLSSLLEHFEVLQKVDTSGVSPTAHSITLRNVMRSDEIAASLLPGEVLANAPQREQDFFKMRAVLGDT